MNHRTAKRFLPRGRPSFLLIGAVALLLAAAAFAVWENSRGPQPVEITYTELLAALDEGRVTEVTVVDGANVEGRIELIGSARADATSDFRALLPIPGSDRIMEHLEAAGVPISARSSSPFRTSRVLPIALIVGLLLATSLYFMRNGPLMRALRFSGFSGRMAGPEQSEVSFNDVAGAEEAKADLEEVVQFLRAPERFTMLGGRMPRGVLLAGDPGNGKTLLARAVAGEAGCAFFYASGSDFVEMYVGTGAARIRDLFRQAREHAPAIVFIDEIDAIGRKRGGANGSGSQDEREHALNQLLVEMDGFERTDTVVVLAATNRSDVLDPALLRPGRFDRRVAVGYPDLRGRQGIFAVHTKTLPLATDVSLESLARGTAGMSGAELANVANEAALSAARRGSSRVMMEDFEEGWDRVLLGSERKSMVLTSEEKRLTAFHEAGHTIVGLMLPALDPVHKVTIIPRERSLGVTASFPVRDQYTSSRAQLRARLVMLMAGRAAEAHILGPELVTTGAGNDIERATKIARQMVARYGMSDRVGMVDVTGESEPVAEDTARIVDEEVRRFVDEAYQSAADMLVEHEDLMHRMATALLERETLGAEELQALVDRVALPPLERAPAPDPTGEVEGTSAA
ncbi:MAG TPA: ATP-dependent zinc metalloprotease FtsH [Longimicrobiales bacterium]|nr:ATP-dependent zinc metalloprotease FtsH [Longimicrobiales bacterium]